VGLHPSSLPRAVNDSLPAQIFGVRMSQTGRLRPVDPLRTDHCAGFDTANLADGPQLVMMTLTGLS
jgi:hypothetical protein